jgi:4-aminobutyrate aminotransferase
LISRRELMEKWAPGSHGGTYGGNAVACAAAVATIEVLKDGVVENAAKMGKVLVAGLKKIQQKHPVMGDVRGLGLMVGVEFTTPDGFPGSDISNEVKKFCLDHDLLLLQCGTYHQVIRWVPPLVVNQEQIETALDIFEKAVASAV